jgi:hypothetical protein
MAVRLWPWSDARPAAAVVSDEDEDATTTRTRRGDKGKARRTEEVGDDDDDDDDEEWDPAATSGKEVQGRRVEECTDRGKTYHSAPAPRQLAIRPYPSSPSSSLLPVPKTRGV